MNDEERKAWLASLKVGDIVAWVSDGSYYGPRTLSVRPISRITKTQIVVGEDPTTIRRFRLDTGRLLGGNWRTKLLPKGDPEAEAVKLEMRLRGLKQQIADFVGRCGFGAEQIPAMEKARDILHEAYNAMQEKVRSAIPPGGA